MNVVYTSIVITGNSDEILYTPTPGWYLFEARIINSCGSSDWFGTEVEYIDCSIMDNGGQEFRAYPNPTSETINIKMKNETLDKTLVQSVNVTTLKLYDYTGHVVIEKNKGDLESLDVSMLKAGLYFLEIRTNEKMERHQISIKSQDKK